MLLTRVVDIKTAWIISNGIMEYNHILCTPRRVLRWPHYAIMAENELAGWLGYRREHGRVYEVTHMVILPPFRRCGLAKEAVLIVLDLIHAQGGRKAFVRINHLNLASQGLAKGLGFKQARTGVVNVFVRYLDGKAVATAAAADRAKNNLINLSPRP